MLRPFHWSPSRAARSLVGVAGQCSRPRPSHWAHVSQRSPGGGASRQSGLAGAAATDRGPDDSAGSSDSEPLRLKLRRATLADAEQLAALCTEVRDAFEPLAASPRNAGRPVGSAAAQQLTRHVCCARSCRPSLPPACHTRWPGACCAPSSCRAPRRSGDYRRAWGLCACLPASAGGLVALPCSGQIQAYTLLDRARPHPSTVVGGIFPRP